jgi:two-component system, OmpR family, response regulator
MVTQSQLTEPMQHAPHLLVVDDDREIRDLLSNLLARRGYRVTTAREDGEMQQALASGMIDLVILDIMLPGKDGLAICRDLRSMKNVPIIMLTARGDAIDRVLGLEMGADDYLPKPFDVRELEARIKAVLRRGGAATPGRENRGVAFAFAGWTLDLRQRQLTSPDGAVVEITSGEFDLLVVLAERPQRVLTRDQLLDLARGREATPFDRSIDIQVSRLRRKIEPDPKNPTLIKTVRGGGYMFTPLVERL